MVKVSTRHAILFPEAEEISNHLSLNDTHVTVAGDEEVIVQSRWTWMSEQSTDLKPGSSTRITWRSRYSGIESSNLSFVMEPVLSPGFNVYAKNKEDMRMVQNPVYSSFHAEHFDVKTWLPTEYDTSFVEWDWARCDFDIRFSNNTLQVMRWCPFPAGDILDLNKEDYLEQSEVGLFYLDISDGKDISLSGLRCNWNSTGHIERCQKTMLIYMPAHLQGKTSLPILLDTPVGLHPKIVINLEELAAKTNCEYYAYLQLPLDLFVDKFQSSPEFLFGEHDLELPEYKLTDKTWGSEVLFKLKSGETNEIAIHSRYAAPMSENDYKTASFGAIIFEACDSGSNKVENNPFYSKGLGYESFFTPDTVFHHLNSTTLDVCIPRPGISHYSNTVYITLGCIVFSLIYLLAKVFGSKRQ